VGDPSDEGTVTEAVASMRALGFGGDAYAVAGGVRCAACGAVHAVSALVVERVVRIEGPTDPSDEAIVLGLRCGECGVKVVLVAGYGAEASGEDQHVVAGLRRDVPGS
jgi:hypothetical protein